MSSTKTLDCSSFTSMASLVEQLVRNKLHCADSNEKRKGAKSRPDGESYDDDQAQGVTNDCPVSSTQDGGEVGAPPDLRL